MVMFYAISFANNLTFAKKTLFKLFHGWSFNENT
jgi:hypothetical protein